jgi:hypothetical protein
MATTSTLVDCLERHFQRFIALDTGLPLVLALWSLATHTYDCFDAFPYLAITSPTKRCGKTRAAEVLELFCFRPLRTVGMTPAVLFRSIEKDKPTLMVDEAEVLRSRDERSSALREILNAGYRKGQKVRRCSGENYALQEFETYCPKVLVLIGNLPDTLADRAIPIRMRRRNHGESVDRFITVRARRDTAQVRADCKKWATKHRRLVAKAYESQDVAFLEDREAELWLPLFVVCKLGAPHRVTDLEGTARHLAGRKASDEPADVGVRLLSDVREIFNQGSRERIQTAVLLKELNRISDAPWEDYCFGKALNSRALGKLLHPFGIWPQNIRVPAVVKGYTLDSFRDAFERYLPSESATPLQGP